ncbi:hypothetical protein BDV06DRAFT_222436 [Aspergillus oleicola]
MLATLSLLLARFIGTAGFISGVIWVSTPIRSLSIFGLPPTHITPLTSTLGPSLGGRNMASGLVILILSFYAERQVTGVVMAVIGSGSGVLDTVVCVRAGQDGKGNRGVGWKRHLVNLGIFYAVAGMLFLS